VNSFQNAAYPPLRLSASKEGYDPGQHKLNPSEGLAMTEARQTKEHCSRNPLACQSGLPAYVVRIANVKTARHRHLRQQFVEGRPIL
jgi:hypothetical protein